MLEVILNRYKLREAAAASSEYSYSLERGGHEKSTCWNNTPTLAIENSIEYMYRKGVRYWMKKRKDKKIVHSQCSWYWLATVALLWGRVVIIPTVSRLYNCNNPRLLARTEAGYPYCPIVATDIVNAVNFFFSFSNNVAVWNMCDDFKPRKTTR